ncbi:hypothetical protein BJ878DRAFT_539363 [Calycina marina]|uniref:18S rRNA factor 2 n=1 Tax=Calycina marina TaxID=1763456 RepID=A0A9P7Z906_9HELO|nr:hypothetical protein BJ878DRAFT_539363 [Calycina marina]
MTTRTYNEFLDLHESEESGSDGYDSEVNNLRKGDTRAKRRKTDSEEDDENESNSDEEVAEVIEAVRSGPEAQDGPLESADLEEQESMSIPKKTRKGPDDLPGISKPLTKKNLVATDKAIRKSGVVYLSRVPPFMKPTKLRSLLEPYGAINRIFLTPEDPTSHTRRVRSGGNKKRSFTDGWVEFVSKRAAREACELLNGQTIGGKKGTYYRDDVWTLIYLKDFKWSNLTEEIAAENAEKSARMRAEISKSTKENKEFVQNAARAKIWETREGKQAAKRKKEETDAKVSGKDVVARKATSGGERPRTFTQTSVATKKAANAQPDQLKRVLSKIL